MGDSFSQAKKRFLHLEKKFVNNPNLKQKYTDFINGYVFLNHAKFLPLTLKNNKGENKYFMPHHAVIREDSETTKLRVVFDASMNTTSGVSLNSILLKGFTVQLELFDIICRFRLYQYVAIADIQKMLYILTDHIVARKPGRKLKMYRAVNRNLWYKFCPLCSYQMFKRTG